MASVAWELANQQIKYMLVLAAIREYPKAHVLYRLADWLATRADENLHDQRSDRLLRADTKLCHNVYVTVVEQQIAFKM